HAPTPWPRTDCAQPPARTGSNSRAMTILKPHDGLGIAMSKRMIYTDHQPTKPKMDLSYFTFSSSKCPFRLALLQLQIIPSTPLKYCSPIA
ncbi:MAG: hypothetical protein AAFP83_19295, partial [Bacteroidota bacterium]